MEDTVATVAGEVTPQALDNPEERQQRECERTPVNEKGRALVLEDGEQRPGDGDAACKITFGAGECIRCGGCLKEEPRKVFIST